VDSVHQAGAKIFAQIMHAGALSQGNRFIQETIGPSAVQPKGKQMEFMKGKACTVLQGKQRKKTSQK